MTPAKQELYDRIDEILWKEWDPISAMTHGLPRDEYQCYTPQIYSLKIKNADQETIAQHLNKIVTEAMGLSGNIEHCKKVAKQIVALPIHE